VKALVVCEQQVTRSIMLST